MKKYLLIAIIACLLFPAFAAAEDFLGAPVVPDAQILQKTKARLELQTRMTHDQVLDFYRQALSNQQDIKFRDWPTDTYIEDDGRLPWHSITIAKQGENGVKVTIAKDNWTWIISTLLLRFIAVFAVLLVLFVAMAIAGRIVSGIIKKAEAKKAGARA